MNTHELTGLLGFFCLLMVISTLVQLKTTAGLLETFKAPEARRIRRILGVHTVLLVISLVGMAGAALYPEGLTAITHPMLLGAAFGSGALFVLLSVVLHTNILFAIERHSCRLWDKAMRMAEERERLSVELEERRQLEGDLWAIVGELRQRMDDDFTDLDVAGLDFVPPNRKN